MTKLRILAPVIRAADTRTTKLPPKDPFYQTPAYRAWRAAVVRRAGGQCEGRDERGYRCMRAWPEHRMYADHIHELRDGGHPLDLNNGQCLCSSHHKMKTDQARASRIKC
jgi:5-methylcytosine-specific restriction protein A